MTDRTVLVCTDGPVATITLNRPHKLNATDFVLVEEFATAAAGVAADPEVRVVLVRGAGRSFCAGLDLDMLVDGVPPGFLPAQERGFRALEEMDKITVAVIHGHCVGGGVQLAAACDIRVAADTARLSIPAVNEGLLPGLAPYRLPRLIGMGRALRLMLTGEPVGGDEAERIGLVDHVLPEAGFEAALEAVVGVYLRAPRASSVATKHLARRSFDAVFPDVLADAFRWFDQCLDAPEVEAARVAWRKRKSD